VGDPGNLVPRLTEALDILTKCPALVLAHCLGDIPRQGQDARKIQGTWSTLSRLTKIGSGRIIRASVIPAYKCIPARSSYMLV
jgi:hypothetical protein